MNTSRRLAAAAVLALAGMLASAGTDVPWKFEGNTNRVAAAESASALACGDFQATDVGQSVTPSPWDDFVNTVLTSAMSDPATFSVTLKFTVLFR